MDKLELTRQKFGRVFNIRSGYVHTEHLCCNGAKLNNLMLQTWPRQPLGFIPLDIMLPGTTHLYLLQK